MRLFECMNIEQFVITACTYFLFITLLSLSLVLRGIVSHENISNNVRAGIALESAVFLTVTNVKLSTCENFTPHLSNVCLEK